MAGNGMLHAEDAKKLIEKNKTEPIWENATSRWLLKFIEPKGIENTTYRINKVCSINRVTTDGNEYDSLPNDNVEYERKPEEIELATIETLIKIPSKVFDVMNYPHNQLNQQIKLTMENIYEHEEDYFINNKVTGLIAQCASKKRTLRLERTIHPDILDELLSMVWNKPSFFLMHPRILAEFSKVCTGLGLTLDYASYFGYTFTTWRGLPIVLSDKIPLSAGSPTHVFLIRTGVKDSGVIQLFNITPTESGYPGVFVKTSETDKLGTVTTRISLYANIAILSTESVASASIVYN